MNYIKKLCILKQVASGFAADGKEVSALLTAERFGGRLTLTVAPIGFAPLAAGRYRCVVADTKGHREAFDLPVPSGASVRRTGELDLEGGIGCAVCFVSGRATPVAFGKTGEGTYDPKALCAAEADLPPAPARRDGAAPREDTTPHAQPSAPARENGSARENAPARESGAARENGARAARPVPPCNGEGAPSAEYAPPRNGEGAPSADDAPPCAAGPVPPYDDEMVATENYFAFADDTQEARGEETPEGRGRAADSPTAAGEEACGCGARSDGSEGGAQKDGDARGAEDEAEEGQTLFRLSGGQNAEACYYDRVRGDLEALFARHPAERDLADCIPYSRWAKVTFSRNKYYAVGVICDEKKPKYICYGVPAASRTQPPAALEGFCSFLPLSVFEPEGRGYWMMFQDADTGQCVRIQPK